MEQLPLVWRQRRLGRALTFKATGMCERAHNYLQHGRFRRSFAGRMIVDEAMPALKRQLYIDVQPINKISAGQSFQLEAPFQKLFLISSHHDPRISVEPWDGTDLRSHGPHSAASILGSPARPGFTRANSRDAYANH